MKDLALHLKYRPTDFDDFIGNDSTIESLKSVIRRKENQVRSFLFTGPSGCGKTTLARIIKEELNCSDKDFYEYNVADVRGIDTIRDISSNSRFAPLSGKVKMYLLDECHKLTTDAQNALLKLLEDTPSHVRFLLCTTDPEKLIKTIRTRCSTYSVSLLPKAKILKLLKLVVNLEEKEVAPEIIKKITDVSNGSPRQALVILDQVVDIEDDEIALQTIIDSTVDEVKVLDLCRMLVDKNTSWEKICNCIKGLENTEPETIRYSVLGYFTSILLNKDSPVIVQLIEIFSDSWIYSGKAGLVSSCYMSYGLIKS